MWHKLALAVESENSTNEAIFNRAGMNEIESLIKFVEICAALREFSDSFYVSLSIHIFG